MPDDRHTVCVRETLSCNYVVNFVNQVFYMYYPLYSVLMYRALSLELDLLYNLLYSSRTHGRALSINFSYTHLRTYSNYGFIQVKLLGQEHPHTIERGIHQKTIGENRMPD